MKFPGLEHETVHLGRGKQWTFVLFHVRSSKIAKLGSKVNTMLAISPGIHSACRVYRRDNDSAWVSSQVIVGRLKEDLLVVARHPAFGRANSASKSVRPEAGRAITGEGGFSGTR